MPAQRRAHAHPIMESHNCGHPHLWATANDTGVRIATMVALISQLSQSAQNNSQRDGRERLTIKPFSAPENQKSGGIMGGKLEGKVAVITGGNSGIGLATAELFRAEGAKLGLFGRDSASLQNAAIRLGGNVLAVQGDVCRIAD